MLKFPEETPLRFTFYYYETYSYFAGVASFDALKKEDNTMKEKVTKNVEKQILVGVTFYMMKALGIPLFIENLGKSCMEDL